MRVREREKGQEQHGKAGHRGTGEGACQVVGLRVRVRNGEKKREKMCGLESMKEPGKLKLLPTCIYLLKGNYCL